MWYIFIGAIGIILVASGVCGIIWWDKWSDFLSKH